MDPVQNWGTEEIMVKVKWTTTNYTKGQSSKKVMLYIWWDRKRVLYYERLLETKELIPASIAPSETKWKQHLLKSA